MELRGGDPGWTRECGGTASLGEGVDNCLQVFPANSRAGSLDLQLSFTGCQTRQKPKLLPRVNSFKNSKPDASTRSSLESIRLAKLGELPHPKPPPDTHAGLLFPRSGLWELPLTSGQSGVELRGRWTAPSCRLPKPMAVTSASRSLVIAGLKPARGCPSSFTWRLEGQEAACEPRREKNAQPPGASAPSGLEENEVAERKS